MVLENEVKQDKVSDQEKAVVVTGERENVIPLVTEKKELGVEETDEDMLALFYGNFPTAA